VIHSSEEVSTLLSALQSGDDAAASKLMPLVYGELRRLAALYMRRERPGQTIQPTALVHDAYLKLVGQERVNWQGRAHFLGIAAITMRRILIERARRRGAEKHGGLVQKVQLEDALLFSAEKSKDLLALDEALTQLGKRWPRRSRVVELRFFGGLSVEEISEVLDVAPSTVKLEWSIARAWLYREIAKHST
jgi:RNA polymerase sigma-70 factor, ECF subfamily